GHDPMEAEAASLDQTDGRRTSAAGPDGAAPPPEATVADAEAAEATTTPTLEQRRADAVHDLARTYLHAEPDDRSGEDRHLVVVQVSAESLDADVPAGTPRGAEPRAADVPAGTFQRCSVVGQG